jgi:hypothetical protein
MSAPYEKFIVGPTKEPIDLAQFEGHTAGPWKVDSFAGTTVWSDNGVAGSIIATCPSKGDPFAYHRDNIVSNARLIAAAPALLAELRERRAKDAAVRELVEACALLQNPYASIEPDQWARFFKAYAALAKAEGGAA